VSACGVSGGALVERFGRAPAKARWAVQGEGDAMWNVGGIWESSCVRRVQPRGAVPQISLSEQFARNLTVTRQQTLMFSILKFQSLW